MEEFFNMKIPIWVLIIIIVFAQNYIRNKFSELEKRIKYLESKFNNIGENYESKR